MALLNRVLIKVSGEALAGQSGYGIDQTIINNICDEILKVHNLGVEVALVVGGGNIHRGVAGATQGMDRSTSDYMGMIATLMNALAIQDNLENRGAFTRVMSAIDVREVAEPYIKRRATRHLEKKRIVIFAAGTGNPYFTTDTAAALRANEIQADVIIKATKVDGIYNKDPMIHPEAVKFDKISYMDILKGGIHVMDSTAISLCMDNNMKIVVLNIFQPDNLAVSVTNLGSVGTLVE
jgi:uridylate kinase